jgi:hypothetical protein
MPSAPSPRLIGADQRGGVLPPVCLSGSHKGLTLCLPVPSIALRACPCPFRRRLPASARVRHRCPVPAAAELEGEASCACAYVRASGRAGGGGGSGVRSGLVYCELQRLAMDACIRPCVIVMRRTSPIFVLEADGPQVWATALLIRRPMLSSMFSTVITYFFARASLHQITLYFRLLLKTWYSAYRRLRYPNSNTQLISAPLDRRENFTPLTNGPHMSFANKHLFFPYLSPTPFIHVSMEVCYGMDIQHKACKRK